jgi:NADPH:quinone reductase-like Zn-dependent oxidoreductase
MFTGNKFPRALGHDFAGVVDAVGPGVTRLKVGDAVFSAVGMKEAGAFAETLVADEKHVLLKPASLSFEQAATLTIVNLTAWNALVDKAKVRAGQAVFIGGCLGGVGRAAVQIALMNGATVTGSCSAADRDEALALGVAEVVDYRNFDVAGYKRRFDIVIDTATKLSMDQLNMLLKSGGRAVHVVPKPAIMLRGLVSSRHTAVIGAPTPGSLAGIQKAVDQGQLVQKFGQVVPLSDAIPAIAALEKERALKGKLVIVP